MMVTTTRAFSLLNHFGVFTLGWGWGGGEKLSQNMEPKFTPFLLDTFPVQLQQF